MHSITYLTQYYIPIKWLRTRLEKYLKKIFPDLDCPIFQQCGYLHAYYLRNQPSGASINIWVLAKQLSIGLLVNPTIIRQEMSECQCKVIRIEHLCLY